jgi:transcription elongation GreA/GreB family factor
MRVPIRKPGKYTHHKIDPYLTPAKLQEFKDELQRLQTGAQPRAISEVKRLAEMGDFSENAAYQIAKGRLRGINERIDELQEAIKRAIVITTHGSSETVQIGSRVTIQLNNKEKIYHILGSTEVDPGRGVISFTSPLGAALIAKRIGDVFTVRLADKDATCKIIRIE